MAKIDSEAAKRERRKQIRWVVAIFFTTILISGVISLVSDKVMANSSVAVAFLILLAIVFLGIVFDIIGPEAPIRGCWREHHPSRRGTSSP